MSINDVADVAGFRATKQINHYESMRSESMKGKAAQGPQKDTDLHRFLIGHRWKKAKVKRLKAGGFYLGRRGTTALPFIM